LEKDAIPIVIASPGGKLRKADIGDVGNERGREAPGSVLEVAFVNNMPDSAFEETEQQFLGLLERAAADLGGTTVLFSRYGLPGLERAPEVQRRITEAYRPLEDIYNTRPDGLIVTGTEPRTDDLRKESYWTPLAELITWAEESTASAVVSCLAAHAAALLFDGIERHSLPEKCSGVFLHEIGTDHPLTDGLGQLVAIPHSRLNDLPSALLRERGYVNLIESPEMTWTLAVKERGSCVFVLVQGHPEYSTTSLLREYRRDLQRFLRGQRDALPAIPVGYVDEESQQLLESFESRVLDRPTRPELMRDFPFEVVAQRLVNTWQVAGTKLYANWLTQIRLRRLSSA